MSYKNSQHWKELKDGIIALALWSYYDSLPEEHSELDILEEVMSECGFFKAEDIETKPSLYIIQGSGVKPKQGKKTKLKACK